jgi:hypothetical protein
MKMFDVNPKIQVQERDFAETGVWTTRAPMLALSRPDPILNIPDGTVLQPKVFLRNTTAKSITVKTAFRWRGPSGSGLSSAPDIVLSPNETRLLDVYRMQADGVLPMDANWAETTVVTDSFPDAVVAVAASFDSTLRYGAQTPFSDQLSSHLEGGQWKVDSTHASLIAVGNGSGLPVNAELTIFYDHGRGAYRLDKTIPGADQWYVNMAQLIGEQVRDKDGNTIPVGTTDGAYRLVQLDNLGHESLFEGKVITDKTYGHATYGCMTCCGYLDSDYGLPFLVNDPTNVGIDSQEVDVYGTNACSGGEDGIDEFFGLWSSLNTSILTASPMTARGVAPGSASIRAQATHVPSGDGQDQRSCPYAPAVATGKGNVPPRVTFGSLTYVTIGSAMQVSVAFTSGFTTSTAPITLTITKTSGSGAATFSGGGTSMTITAPTTVNIVGVTASDTPNNLLLDAVIQSTDGSANQEVATNPQSFTVVSVAVPVNFQTYGVNTGSLDGTIVFSYTWQSSTGRLQDIAACIAGETAFYPGTLTYYIWPLPMVSKTNNPFPNYVNGNNTGPNGTTAGFGDYIYPPTSYQTPYSPGNNFDATQYLQWSCDNYNDGSFNLFVPKITISRKVAQNPTTGKWVYTATKSGYSNSAVLPNQ